MTHVVFDSFPRTDLERYALREFQPLLSRGLKQTKVGKAFAHPTEDKQYVELTPYPFRFVGEPLVIGQFEEPLPSSSRPRYINLRGVHLMVSARMVPLTPTYKALWGGRIPKEHDSQVVCQVKTWEDEPLEALHHKAFPHHRNQLTGELQFPISYREFRSFLQEDFHFPTGRAADEIKVELLDGVEVEGREDMLAFLAIASPPASVDRMQYLHAGGFHSALLGQSTASVVYRLANLTTDPFMAGMRQWDVFASDSRSYKKQYSHRSPKLAWEYAVLVSQRKKPANLSVDYPVVVAKAPSRKEEVEERRSNNRMLYGNPDLLNYLAYTRFTTPSFPDFTSQAQDISQDLADWVSHQGIPSSYVGQGRLFDPNYLGKPETVLRLSLAMARIHDASKATNYLKPAKEMLFMAFDTVVDQLTHQPRTILTLKKTARYLLAKVEELEGSYPAGVPINKLREEVPWNRKDFGDVLTQLLREGQIFESPPKHYRMIGP